MANYASYIIDFGSIKMRETGETVRKINDFVISCMGAVEPTKYGGIQFETREEHAGKVMDFVLNEVGKNKLTVDFFVYMEGYGERTIRTKDGEIMEVISHEEWEKQFICPDCGDTHYLILEGDAHYLILEGDAPEGTTKAQGETFKCSCGHVFDLNEYRRDAHNERRHYTERFINHMDLAGIPEEIETITKAMGLEILDRIKEIKAGKEPEKNINELKKIGSELVWIGEKIALDHDVKKFRHEGKVPTHWDNWHYFGYTYPDIPLTLTGAKTLNEYQKMIIDIAKERRERETMENNIYNSVGRPSKATNEEMPF